MWKQLQALSTKAKKTALHIRTGREHSRDDRLFTALSFRRDLERWSGGMDLGGCKRGEQPIFLFK